jgi:hypothetical protein
MQEAPFPGLPGTAIRGLSLIHTDKCSERVQIWMQRQILQESQVKPLQNVGGSAVALLLSLGQTIPESVSEISNMSYEVHIVLSEIFLFLLNLDTEGSKTNDIQ